MTWIGDIWWAILDSKPHLVAESVSTPQPHTLRIGDADVPYALIRTKQRRRTIAFAIEGREGLVVRAPMKASF